MQETCQILLGRRCPDARVGYRPVWLLCIMRTRRLSAVAGACESSGSVEREMKRPICGRKHYQCAGYSSRYGREVNLERR